MSMHDGKDGLLHLSTHSAEHKSQVRRTKYLKRAALVAFCAALAYCAYASYDATPPAQLAPQLGCASHSAVNGNADPEAIWETIKPGIAENLPWTDCYGDSGLLCAKLTVPLDYARPQDGDAVIALVKVPAAIAPTDPRYKGPILFNPGGPGGSGVSLISIIGRYFQQLLGAEFDIIGFDPRGVARTKPQVLIFPDGGEDASWHVALAEAPLWNTSADAVPRLLAWAQTLGSLAEARVKHDASYVSTALVARDMLSITHALGREKLQYWGFSYGTILGATFAAMFPDKVERLVIDGVVDADDYYTTSWKKILVDTDKEFFQFFQECVDAGPDLCALHESTPQRVHARLTNILEKLKRSPIAVPTKNGTGPLHDYGILDYKWTRRTLTLFLYSPYVGARVLASALRAVEDGDGAPLWSIASLLVPQVRCSCPAGAPTLETTDAIQAIGCGDGLVVDDTVEESEKYMYDLRKQSEFADAFPFRLTCNGWKVRPAERFAGPFVGNTSYPLLLIGNVLDPVTPLSNAHTMSKGFNGSVVLTQKSAGHCSLSATSPCTAKAIREYFREGTLPEKGTECDILNTMFEGMKPQDDALSGENMEIMNAWSVLNEMFPKLRRGLVL